MSSDTRSNSPPSSVNSVEKNCAICLSNFDESDQVSGLPCSHLFHTECINQWLENTPRCPICRTDIHQLHPISEYNEIGNRSGGLLYHGFWDVLMNKLRSLDVLGIWHSLENDIGLPLELLHMFVLLTSDSSEGSDSDTEDTDETSSEEDTTESDSNTSLQFDMNIGEQSITDSSSDGSDVEDNTNSRASISQSSSTSDTDSETS